MNTKILEIEVKKISGQKTSLNEFKGKVMMVVNVASECGLTPQYEQLEKMYQKYKDQGLVILGFPANEFGAQEPGTNSQIQDFCQSKFGVQFPLFEKIVVKGEAIHPLYKELIDLKPSAIKSEDGNLKKVLIQHNLLSGTEKEIMWNFEKFIINRQGEVVERFAPDIAPDNSRIIECLEKELVKN